MNVDAGKARPRAALLLTSASAAALYFAAYAAAIRISFGFGPLKAVLTAAANTLPDILAAPLVLRAASGPPRRGSVWRLAVLAAGFAAWSILGTGLGLAVLQAVETGTFRYTIEPRGAAWKALLSLLAFGVLAGVARVRYHAREAREASERALHAETVRAEARLAVLRAQLNPHFILNVLHSLVGLAERDPRATALALERLGTTLRYALRVQSRGTDRVALREELEFTREYLELERMRLGERLRTRISAPESALGRVVPPFVLQPLVENAVVHAVAPRARGGEVRVAIEVDGGELLLRVEDDGDGASRAGERGNGLGLALLKDRLDALYGRGAGIEAGRSASGGYAVSVRLTGEPGEEGST